jgi:mRNA interferase HigB
VIARLVSQASITLLKLPHLLIFGINVDFLGDNRVVFDIGGNKYRLVVRFAYKFKSALIKFVGTHAEYDRMDAETL